MKYMGSKNRVAMHLIPIVTKYLDEDRWYVEPFCGGCNMIDKIVHKHRFASDSNNYLIAMWRFLVYYNFNFPTEISKHTYDYWRTIFNNRGFKGDGTLSEEAMIGWVGFMGSFNGRFFDGGYSGHNVNGRDYINEQIRNTLAQIGMLKGVVFETGDYYELKIPDKSVIYCDPPYAGTKQYSTSKDFNHNRFWQWCRERTEEGHDVLISEYNAPSDFQCVWQRKITNAMNQKNTHLPTEKLFVYKSIASKYIENQQTLF